jgi:hypothetical protein
MLLKIGYLFYTLHCLYRKGGHMTGEDIVSIIYQYISGEKNVMAVKTWVENGQACGAYLSYDVSMLSVYAMGTWVVMTADSAVIKPVIFDSLDVEEVKLSPEGVLLFTMCNGGCLALNINIPTKTALMEN